MTCWRWLRSSRDVPRRCTHGSWRWTRQASCSMSSRPAGRARRGSRSPTPCRTSTSSRHHGHGSASSPAVPAPRGAELRQGPPKYVLGRQLCQPARLEQELLAALDHEPGLSDGPGDVAGEVTATGDPAPERLDAALPAGDARVVGDHMLLEAQLAGSPVKPAMVARGVLSRIS